MANHTIPARRTKVIEELTATNAAGTFVCRVYEHTRQGHALPEFYVLQFRRRDDGRMDRSTRVTSQISGKNARARLDAEMTEVRALFAEADTTTQGDTQS